MTSEIHSLLQRVRNNGEESDNDMDAVSDTRGTFISDQKISLYLRLYDYSILFMNIYHVRGGEGNGQVAK